MEINIREATREDCPRLMELIRELAVYEKAPEQVTVSLDHFEESGFGEKPVWWAICAEADGVVYGFALYYIRYSTWKGQAIYLEDLLVTEKMRGKGIGKLLLDELINIARNKGFKRITWQVLEWNEPAINFYRNNNASFDTEWWNVTVDIAN